MLFCFFRPAQIFCRKQFYRIYSINRSGGLVNFGPWEWALIRGERLLNFSAVRMGAYSRWALIRGWALIRMNTLYCLTLRFWFSFLMAWQWKTAIRTSSWLASLAWRFCWAHYPQKRSLTFAHFGLFARPTKTAMLRRIPADRFWALFS